MIRALLTMRVDTAPPHGERRDGVSQEWPAWLAALGADAFPAPNRADAAERYFDAVRPDVLILSGGNDVGLGAQAGRADAPERDAAESALIAEALRRGCPILGVCRGLQILNIHFGGQLSSVEACTGNAAGHVARNHDVRLRGPFADIAGAGAIQVNSYHNQAIPARGLADDLLPFATDSRGQIVEGFAHAELPILGVQWHPERPTPSVAFDHALCGRLLSDGAFWKGKM